MVLGIPKHIWIEWHDLNEPEARDVILEMEDGAIYTALYVTFGYLERQMMLSHDISSQVPDAPPVYHAVLDTPHVIVPNLERATIEDSIDNLLALETFESVFTLVTESEAEAVEQAPVAGKRATQEIAAVFLNNVLLVEDDDPTTVA
ncbi:hypothetical protein J4558_26415 [Leptolyngbya sp. 15MV]|nr:hypothetical protein J4558_26415 [Leptolyngbya sp. 15MV]